MAVVQEVGSVPPNQNLRTREAAPLAGSILDKSASRSHISFKRWTNIVRIALTLPNKRLTANGWKGASSMSSLSRVLTNES